MKLSLSVAESIGERENMEDCHKVQFIKSNDGYLYLAVFDGHGSEHAAIYAKENLLNEITSQKGFWSSNDDEVLEAIQNGFALIHQQIIELLGKYGHQLYVYPTSNIVK